MFKDNRHYIPEKDKELNELKRQVQEASDEERVIKSFFILGIFALVLILLILLNDYGPSFPHFSDIFPGLSSILNDELAR